MWFLRGLYLLNSLSSATWGRYGTLYYLDKGLSKAEIGLIEGLMPMVGVFAQSAWAVVADARHARKGVYLLTSSLGTCVLLLLGVEAVVGRSFARILCVSLGSKAFACGGILDAYAFEVVGSQAPKLYGRLRLWGSLGWGCGGLAMGAINDAYGFGPNFLIYGACNALRIALVGACVKPAAAEDTKKPIRADLIAVLRSPALLAFLGEILIFGTAVGVVERLIFVYVVDNLDGDSLLCGLVVFVSSTCNIPVFHNAGVLLEKFGPENLLLLAQFCYFTRVVGYTLLTPETKYFILGLETLHGCTFAMLWIAAVERARHLAPDGWAATLQSLLQTVYYSFGPGLGALLGGYLWHLKNARFMYRSFALAVFLHFAIRAAAAAAPITYCRNTLLQRQRRRRCPPSQQDDDDDDDDDERLYVALTDDETPDDDLDTTT
ncbi:hypothetical protein CTAYLR_005132 [Chrysophaeum taylorii]|uniref:Major facilitator superfamily associated domain-containing protein n=1 Tax=Chrysophaeum taylorii TaxID=2483200 RepID=A0AAD7UEU7_9STRA|nr:hypothetical protein CTAYLR_005132 [Chrysophaeum taylorii]